MPVTPDALNRLLAGFVSRDDKAAEEFKKVASPIVRGLARRFGPDLPADIIDEVVSETYLLLLGRPGRCFDPARGSAREFLFGIVGNAVKNVRASNRPPGLPTRRRNDEPELMATSIITFDELLHSRDQRLLPDVRQIEARIDAQALLLGTVASVFAAAIIAIHIRGENASSVSRRLGVSRFQVNRALQRTRSAAQPPARGAVA